MPGTIKHLALIGMPILHKNIMREHIFIALQGRKPCKGTWK